MVVEKFSKYARSLDDHTPSGTTWEFASDGIAISIIYLSGQGSRKGGEVATSSEERLMESHIIFSNFLALSKLQNNFNVELLFF